MCLFVGRSVTNCCGGTVQCVGLLVVLHMLDGYVSVVIMVAEFCSEN